MKLALLAASCLLAFGAGCRTPADPPGGGGTPVPRLVLVLVIDQGRPERVEASLPGGLGRFAREGRVFVDAAHAHARTETCPGHAVMLSGVQPGRAGLPGNRFIVNGTREVRYCVQEDEPDGALLTRSNEVDPSVLDARVAGLGRGRSPRQMRVDALGDWMKASWPQAKVHSVSAKDRAAITLGGQRPDAAWWLDRGGSGAFTTSLYYRDELPQWVAAWSRERVLEGIPQEWVYGEVAFAPDARVDDYPYESDRFRRTEPHPLVDADSAMPSLSPIEASPWLDTKTLAFASELARREQLGADDVPDLLAVSLSGTDIIGHHYGPDSREARAAWEALDADLGAFLAGIEEQVGRDGLLVVLTSDHGVLPLPEWWQAKAGSDPPCPVEGGRIDPTRVEGAVAAALVDAFGDDWSRGWVRDGPSFGFDAALGDRDGVTLEMAIAVARTALQGFDFVERTWTRGEIVEAAEEGDPMSVLWRNQLADGRGGDLFVQTVHGCLVTGWPVGTSHGSPHDYDLDVPLVFWGAGVTAGRMEGPAAPVDIAPTLADALGLEAPPDLDGRVLALEP